MRLVEPLVMAGQRRGPQLTLLIASECLARLNGGRKLVPGFQACPIRARNSCLAGLPTPSTALRPDQLTAGAAPVSWQSSLRNAWLPMPDKSLKSGACKARLPASARAFFFLPRSIFSPDGRT